MRHERLSSLKRYYAVDEGAKVLTLNEHIYSWSWPVLSLRSAYGSVLQLLCTKVLLMAQLGWYVQNSSLGFHKDFCIVCDIRLYCQLLL